MPIFGSGHAFILRWRRDLRQTKPGYNVVEGGLLMKGQDWAKLILFGLAGLVVISAISQAKWCGPTCRVLMSDARGTLVQDIVTGIQYWV